MQTIRLTQGKVALVDDEDFDSLSQFKWCAIKARHTYYAYRSTPKVRGKYQAILMHRTITHAQKGRQVDHINGDGLDNRKLNLRLCTSQQNAMNRRARLNGTSAFKGVLWVKRDRKWRAHIKLNGKRTVLGQFKNEVDAAHAYDKAANELFGSFARLNFPLAQMPNPALD